MVYSAWMTAILAGVICLVIMLMIMPGLIRYLHKIKFGQTEREEGLESHKKKNGTPTMGGLAFILVPTIIYIAGSFILPDMRFSQNILIILLAYVGYGLIGFLDDYIIVVKKDNEGLKPGAKFLLQAVLAIIFFMIYRSGPST